MAAAAPPGGGDREVEVEVCDVWDLGLGVWVSALRCWGGDWRWVGLVVVVVVVVGPERGGVCSGWEWAVDERDTVVLL